MSEALFSPQWYRVATLKPKLRSHARIHRHTYREQVWYVLQDRANERFHRFSPAAYALIGLLDGGRTVQDVWETVCTELRDDAPTQGDVIQLLSQLHAADLLQCELPSDASELFRRFERQKQRKWRQRFMSLFSWQIPLWDPERFLTACLPIVRPFFSWWGVLLWCLVVVPALALGAVHWTDLTSNMLDRAVTPRNLVALWFLFPVIKLLHELGHAFAVKAFGGEVHDLGVMFLVFTPVPYVEASASWAFRSKWQRIAVGGAGMIVEIALAAVALYIWSSVEPGLVRTLAYNTIMVAGISTVLFNANPLLQFDGYYMLADYLEIPNLKTRANKYMGYLFQRYIAGHRAAIPGPMIPEERWRFVGYATAAYVYRIGVVFGILLFLAEQWLLLGFLFAGLTAFTWILIPFWKGLAFLFRNAGLRPVRVRALGATAAILGGIALLLGWLPLPDRSRAEGVVWIPEDAHVRAGREGFVEKVVSRPGSRVRAGDVLVVCADSVLSSKLVQLEAQREEVTAKIRAQLPESLVKAQMLEEQRKFIEQNLARVREQVDALAIRSNVEGTFVLSSAEDLPGRFLKQGELLAYVVDLNRMTVRAVVDQDDINLIQDHTVGVQIRLAERIAEPLDAQVARFVPAASDSVPSPALGNEGGGVVPLDPRDPEGQKTLRRIFQVDMTLPAPQGLLNVGGRVFVRFDHGTLPLAAQWYRKGRQLFLSRFHV